MVLRKPVAASWLSFQGAFQRVRSWASRINNPLLRAAFWLPGVVILIAWWAVTAAWYVVWLVLFMESSSSAESSQQEAMRRAAEEYSQRARD